VCLSEHTIEDIYTKRMPREDRAVLRARLHTHAGRYELDELFFWIHERYNIITPELGSGDLTICLEPGRGKSAHTYGEPPPIDPYANARAMNYVCSETSEHTYEYSFDGPP